MTQEAAVCARKRESFPFCVSISLELKAGHEMMFSSRRHVTICLRTFSITGMMKHLVVLMAIIVAGKFKGKDFVCTF